jgi:hypothetical protein
MPSARRTWPAAGPQPPVEGGEGGCPEGDDAAARALPGDGHLAPIEVDVGEGDTGDLAAATSGIEQEQHERLVASAAPVGERPMARRCRT